MSSLAWQRQNSKARKQRIDDWESNQEWVDRYTIGVGDNMSQETQGQGRSRCPGCGLPGAPMPEDATREELLCNSWYENTEVE